MVPDVVLVVDDEPSLRHLTARWLKRPEIRIVECPNGRSALAWLNEHAAEVLVVVLDVMMPDIDGFQVLTQLQERPETRDIPVVLVTAHATEESDELRGIELGAYDHMQKPFRGPVLAARVHALAARRRAQAARSAELKRAESVAHTDPLTGLGNRRQFDQSVAREGAFAIRKREALSLAILDLDDFKSINDLFGHPEGDRVLVTFASALSATMRGSDEAFRLGGEEFGLLLRATDPDGAIRLLERLQASQRAAPMRLGSTTSRVIRFSAGVASADAKNEFDIADLYARADRALYGAKRAGKDRVELETTDDRR